MTRQEMPPIPSRLAFRIWGAVASEQAGAQRSLSLAKSLRRAHRRAGLDGRDNAEAKVDARARRARMLEDVAGMCLGRSADPHVDPPFLDASLVGAVSAYILGHAESTAVLVELRREWTLGPRSDGRSIPDHLSQLDLDEDALPSPAVMVSFLASLLVSLAD